MVSENRREMIRLLISVWEDRDFLIGVNAHLKNESHVDQMVEWLKRHNEEEISSSEILLKAMEIRYGKRFEANGVTTRD